MEYPFRWNEHTVVHLVDTPGFDDTNRTDTEVLKEIAGWLTETYSNEIKLNGIIYLHRISDLRLQGSAKRNLGMFKKLCGDDALKNIVLTTTMWEQVPQDLGHAREAELVAKEDFWGWMVNKGSKTQRHHNNQESALGILRQFAIDEAVDSTVTLDIQTQMVEDGKLLDETSAGIELGEGMVRDRNKLLDEIEAMKQEIMEADKERDRETAAMLREQQAEMDARIQQMDEDRERLKTDTERLYYEREARLKSQLDQALARTENMQTEFESTTENQRRRYEQEVLESQRARDAFARELAASQTRSEKLKTDTERLYNEREARLKRELDKAAARTEQLQLDFKTATENQRLDYERGVRESERAKEALARELEASQARMQRDLKMQRDLDYRKSLEPRVRSHPGRNRIDEFCSVSLGDLDNEYFFCGPAQSYSRWILQPC